CARCPPYYDYDVGYFDYW
nr:immunoglobulin heavy chain junction region [Mus musculus]NSM08255.1 immunoglobulin heavy chain junction region [Mus musculus]